MELSSSYSFMLRGLAVPAVTSIADRLVLHPLETIFTVQQSKGVKFRVAYKKLQHNYGYKGFYRGLSIPLIMSGLPLQIALFGTYFGLKGYINDNFELVKYPEVFSALISGVVGSLVACPPDAKRTRDIFGIRIHTPYSPGVFFRGYSMVLPKLVIYTQFTLCGTDYIKSQFQGDNLLLPFVTSFFLAGFAVLVTNPIEVIKTRMMSDKHFYNDGTKNRSISNYVREVAQTNTWFNGLFPRMMRFSLGAGLVVGCSHYLNDFIDQQESVSSSASLKQA